MLNLSDVEFSSWDNRNKIKLPKSLTPELAEETGLHIGDGCLIITNKLYMYSLRGHLKDDSRFYNNYISEIYRRTFNLDPKIRAWPDVIGFQTFSKAIGTFKSRILKLPIGPKTEISIPEVFFDKNLTSHVIRGIFDTDGCLDFEKKSRDKPYYPRITISTTSKKLSEQVSEILSNQLEFNISLWKLSYKGNKWKPLYRVCTRGEKNLNDWFKRIGSNNPKNIDKYIYWKKHGYALVAQ